MNPLVYDSKGTPIYPGDLCRSLHFKVRHGRGYSKRYLYHVACCDHDGNVEMVPVCYLDPGKLRGQTGGRFWLTEHSGKFLEVIQGYGPGAILDYRGRPKNRVAP